MVKNLTNAANVTMHYGEVEKIAESGQLWELISQQFFAKNT